MTLATQILRAEHIGSKDLRERLSQNIRSQKPVIITEHGQPKKVMLPYEMMVALIEMIEDLQDKDLMAVIAEGKKVIASGSGGVPIERSFKKIKSSRKA